MWLTFRTESCGPFLPLILTVCGRIGLWRVSTQYGNAARLVTMFNPYIQQLFSIARKVTNTLYHSLIPIYIFENAIKSKLNAIQTQFHNQCTIYTLFFKLYDTVPVYRYVVYRFVLEWSMDWLYNGHVSPIKIVHINIEVKRILNLLHE